MLRMLVWGGPKQRGAEPRLSLGVDTGAEIAAAQTVPLGEWSWVEVPLSKRTIQRWSGSTTLARRLRLSKKKVVVSPLALVTVTMPPGP